MTTEPAPPSTAGHPLGTDQLGRDMLSRVIYGSVSVLAVAPAATALGVGLGTLLGLVTGYLGGWIDEAIMVLSAQLCLFVWIRG